MLMLAADRLAADVLTLAADMLTLAAVADFTSEWSVTNRKASSAKRHL